MNNNEEQQSQPTTRPAAGDSQSAPRTTTDPRTTTTLPLKNCGLPQPVVKKLNRRLRKIAAKELKRQQQQLLGSSAALLLPPPSGSSTSSSSTGCTPPSPAPHHVQLQSHWLKVRLSQGKNRQIRRLCARAQLEVLRLVRVAVGPVALLPSTKPIEEQGANATTPLPIAPGTVRSLTETELKACYKLALPGQDCPALLPLPPPSLPTSDTVHRRGK